MWLSRSFKSTEQHAAETGVITLNTDDVTEANSSLPSRSAQCFSPYGYSSRIPGGEEVLIAVSYTHLDVYKRQPFLPQMR